MPLSLTCDCGARFDADDLLAGQDVPCPECAEPVRAAGKPTPRLSLWAVAALALALLGALTPVGGLAALLVGVVALVRIQTRPDRPSGTAMALIGSLLGLAGALVTGVVILRPDALPVAGWLRQQARAG